MQRFVSSLLMGAFLLLGLSGCVSRTTTQERGYGDDTTESKLIWIWQKDFRKPK